MNERLYFYFTSDLHSYFDNWPKIMQGIKEKTVKHEDDNEFFMLFDNGDHMDRSHPVTEATLGSGNVDILNFSGFQTVTLGNNEGITLPAERLFHLYDQANFDVVCANINLLNQTNPSWLKPYQIYYTNSGISIGVLGLTAPFQAFYEQLGWQTEDPMNVLHRYIDELRDQSDVVIILSHLGYTQDEVIAQEFDVDVIIGGHTHHLLKQGHIENGTLLTAVGKHGHYYGEIILNYDSDLRCITNKEAYAISVENAQEDLNSRDFLTFLENEAKHHLDQVVTNLNHSYPIDWLRETSLMRAFVDTLKTWTNSDCALLNSGVLLKGFDRGPITKRQVHQSCPHPMNPCTMILTGKELIEMVRMMEQERFIHLELKGLGFRGKKIGKMVYADLEIEYHDETDYVETVYIKGEKVNPKARYKIATADTFSFPWLVPPISSVKEKQYFLPEFLRDLLEECLKSLK